MAVTYGLKGVAVSRVHWHMQDLKFRLHMSSYGLGLIVVKIQVFACW
jgi:hypothetical protein